MNLLISSVPTGVWTEDRLLQRPDPEITESSEFFLPSNQGILEAASEAESSGDSPKVGSWTEMASGGSWHVFAIR